MLRAVRAPGVSDCCAPKRVSTGNQQQSALATIFCQVVLEDKPFQGLFSFTEMNRGATSNRRFRKNSSLAISHVPVLFLRSKTAAICESCPLWPPNLQCRGPGTLAVCVPWCSVRAWYSERGCVLLLPFTASWPLLPQAVIQRDHLILSLVARASSSHSQTV